MYLYIVKAKTNCCTSTFIMRHFNTIQFVYLWTQDFAFLLIIKQKIALIWKKTKERAILWCERPNRKAGTDKYGHEKESFFAPWSGSLIKNGEKSIRKKVLKVPDLEEINC